MLESLQPYFAHYSPGQWVMIVGVMALGSVIQGAVGFASGLFAIPLLVLGGAQLQEAATINFLLTSVQNSFAAWRLRDHLSLRETALPVLFRWIGLPLGAAVMWGTSSLDAGFIKQLLGGMLLVMVVALWLWRAKHRESISLPTTAVAFLLSGFLLGFASIGGAPMVLYVNALNWSATKCRAFLFLVSATGAPLMAVMLAWNFGASLLPACLAALTCLPIVWLGLQFGLRLGKNLNKPLFRSLTFTLLTLIALSALLTPLLIGR